MKNNCLIPIVLFSIVATVYALPIFTNITYWGQMDWDQFIFWNAVPRETILRYHQFPLWNPYANGGNIALAHPHSPFLSPFYILVLIFGPVVGLKLEIVTHLVVGLLGMYCLAKYFKLKADAAYFCSFVFMLSSVYALHMTDGHAEWMSMAFIPWLFMYYLKSFDDQKYILSAIIFLGLMIFTGPYVFNISVMFLSIYALMKAVYLRKIIPIKLLFIIFVGTFLFCAVKLIPMIEFFHQFPRFTDESSGTSLFTLSKMLLGREQVLLKSLNLIELPAQVKGLELTYQWHEYGAYIGLIPLILCFYGAMKEAKRNWPLIVTGLIFLLISLGSKSPINLWGALHSLPVYDSLNVPSRFILVFIFSAAILSGFGLTYFQKFISTVFNGKYALFGRAVSFAIVAFVLIDLLLVSAPIFKQAFRIVPFKTEKNYSFAQRFIDKNFIAFQLIDNRTRHLSYSSMYPIFLSNSGILNGYEVVHVKKGDVRIQSHPKYRGGSLLIEI